MSDSCVFLTALKSSLTHAVDVRWVRETGSTNDDLKLWAHKRGFDKPVLLTADYQTSWAEGLEDVFGVMFAIHFIFR